MVIGYLVKCVMRLWSIHPQYLDGKGLVACWRESLLAKAVLSGQTRGYRAHPQLVRFQSHSSPLAAMNQYLRSLHEEARKRGYAFDKRKIGKVQPVDKIPITVGQARYELSHLKRKLWKRDRKRFYVHRSTEAPRLHPLFRLVDGPVEKWERKN